MEGFATTSRTISVISCATSIGWPANWRASTPIGGIGRDALRHPCQAVGHRDRRRPAPVATRMLGRATHRPGARQADRERAALHRRTGPDAPECSRAHRLEALHDDGRDTSDRAVDSHFKNLRRKLQSADLQSECIASVYGVGYRFDAPSPRLEELPTARRETGQALMTMGARPDDATSSNQVPVPRSAAAPTNNAN
ncbi:MAG: winged helix-turn-helix domain-containing protein [Burkholderiaceae bacterium]